jgi:hypothetical protein
VAAAVSAVVEEAEEEDPTAAVAVVEATDHPVEATIAVDTAPAPLLTVARTRTAMGG